MGICSSRPKERERVASSEIGHRRRPEYSASSRHKIFVSFRFAEAETEAKELQRQLEHQGISTFVCDVCEGDSIQTEVSQDSSKKRTYRDFKIFCPFLSLF